MYSKWLDKFKKIFGEEDNNESSLPGKRVYTSIPNEIEGRVQNIYPKPGAYRFPIELNQHTQQQEKSSPREKRIRKVDHGKDMPPKVQPIPPKKKNNDPPFTPMKKESYYQGSLKQAKVSPSPIYGYKKKVDSELFDPSGNVPSVEHSVYIEDSISEQDESEVYAVQKADNVDPVKVYLEDIELEEEFLGIDNENVQASSEENIEETKDQTKEEIKEDRQEERQEERKIASKEEIKEETKEETKEEITIDSNKYIVKQPINMGYKEDSYQFPNVASLHVEGQASEEEDDIWIDNQATILMETFQHFNLKAELIGFTQGPAVTRFEIQPAPGIKISKFTNLQDDLKLSLAAKEIRIEAPIPGKNAIGIEVPNRKSKPVHLGEILTSEQFKNAESSLTICLGSNLSGEPVVTDIQKMPHGLIAGSTGSGKSVCINSLLVSLLYKASPEQLRLLLIDPKVVELTPYQSIPHLVTPVVTDPKRATAALKWAVDEMERRYLLFADEGVRDLGRYNKVLTERTGEEYTLPYIVIIIDELADLMMVAPQDVEDAICRIAQKARACGIHLIVATQRPSVDVITGLIKANIPTRLAFTVSSQVDSRTILDMSGAERLLGRGDMLFLQNGSSKPIRVQGNFVSDEEIEEVISQVSSSDTQRFLFSQEDLVSSSQDADLEDELIEETTFFVMEQGVASASSLQRKFRIGYNRAARLIDWMEEQGIITESLGSKPRNVIWSQEQFLDWLDRHQEGS
jgi:S-DNA-T family DNA segregation ATPase FtsK/SpoIIIE